jgi:hypothetical protein
MGVLRSVAIQQGNPFRAKCSAKSLIAGLQIPGAISRDRSLFSMDLRLEILSAGEIGEFFRKKRARQDSNLRPPA